MSVKIIRGKRDMPELSVDTKELFEAAEEMKKLLYQCDSVTQELDQVISCFHYQINSDGYDREVNGLITQSTNLKSTRENLASAANTLQQIAECYEKVASYTNIVDMYVSDFKDNYIENFFPEVRDAILGNLGKGMKEGIQFCNLTEDRMEKFFNYEIPYEDIASVRTYIPMTRLVQIQLKSGEIKIFAVNKRKIWVYEIEQKKKKGW